ncbi:MAG: replicative DNA helicase [Clostridiales bacterium]|nr:replicative DNA helicase [Clostridiales bacterium]
MEEIFEQAPIEQKNPHSMDAERSVLGSMLLELNALEQMLEQLKPDDFYKSAHKDIFEAMRQINGDGRSVDLITLSNELERYGKLDRAGGTVYLTELMAFVPTTENVSHYAEIVEERSVQRGLIRAGNEMVRLGGDDARDVDKSLEQAEKMIFDISMRKSEESLVPIEEIVQPALIEIGEVNARKGRLTGIDTGFRRLNQLTNGLQRSDLVIIAGRPGMGKTSFAMNIAEHAALRDSEKKRSVVVFSLEMSRNQLVKRMLCSEASVDSQKINEGNLSDAEVGRLMDAGDTLEASAVHIDDLGGATVREIRTKCRRLKAQKGLDMVVIDYLQLMDGTGEEKRKSDSRYNDVSSMTREFKRLARELDVPILLLSQLNRASENRPASEGGRPRVSDLRESGSIEQDADLVMLLYRPKPDPDDPSTNTNVAEVIIGKNRHGPTETIQLAWQGEFTRFRDIAWEA